MKRCHAHHGISLGANNGLLGDDFRFYWPRPREILESDGWLEVATWDWFGAVIGNTEQQ